MDREPNQRNHSDGSIGGAAWRAIDGGSTVISNHSTTRTHLKLGEDYGDFGIAGGDHPCSARSNRKKSEGKAKQSGLPASG